MPSEFDPVQDLATLLREVGASPRVSPERIVRSTLYDLHYHIALIACVFFTTVANSAVKSHSLVAHWLKLLQFIAVRPNLLPSFQAWSSTRRHQDLDTRQLMPRGYVGDSTHDSTVELLVAGRVLARKGDALVAGERIDDLRRVYDDLVSRHLLRSERATLLALSHNRVNKTLLTGI